MAEQEDRTRLGLLRARLALLGEPAEGEPIETTMRRRQVRDEAKDLEARVTENQRLPYADD